MTNYTTGVSDKSKKKAIRLLLFGGIGLHLFYVGRIKAGIIRTFFGSCIWMLIIAGFTEPIEGATLSGVVLLILFNIKDLITLLLGTFHDNVGNVLRA